MLLVPSTKLALQPGHPIAMAGSFPLRQMVLLRPVRPANGRRASRSGDGASPQIALLAQAKRSRWALATIISAAEAAVAFVFRIVARASGSGGMKRRNYAKLQPLESPSASFPEPFQAAVTSARPLSSPRARSG